MNKEEFVRKIYAAAVRIGEIDPIFVTAQAALESGWGAKSIGTYNIFGITKGSWIGECRLVLTTEYFSDSGKKFVDPEKVVSVERSGNKWRYKVYRLFRVYKSYEECLRDHLAILQKPIYMDAWEYRKDRHKFLRLIAEKYATSPDYIEIMESMFKSVERRL
jgi:flagellum-specific peptidoglycan hydrolase FlgJ